MAVADKFQGKGLGSQIISALEDVARGKGIQRIILSAREKALQFYKNNGYEIIEKTHLLFGKIQHWLMRKKLG
jgi:GNAT superfamily N-acetyltransferase